MIGPRQDNGQSTGYVLNLAMLGTGQHSTKVENVLTSWIESIDTKPNQFTHLINGPGAPSSDPNNPMLGTYDGKVELDGNDLNVTKTPRSYLQSKTHTGGQLKGSGYDDAIDEALNVVRAIMKQQRDQNINEKLTLNMAGFSRGADTILRISNAVYAEFGEKVEINVFAIDPVPGPFRQSSRKARIIPPNVKDYTAVLMRDEARLEMRAQDKSHVLPLDPSQTKMTYYQFHGIHGTGTRFHGDPNSDHPTLDAARLTWDAIEQFTQNHGGKFKDRFMPYKQRHKDEITTFTSTGHLELANYHRLEAYSRMRDNKESYAALGRKFGTQKRNFNEHNSDYFYYGQDYFVDKQHMELFKKEFPYLFDYLFNANSKEYDPNLKSVLDLKKMEQFPDIASSLKKYLNIPQEKALANNLPKEPRGIPELSPELIKQWEGIQQIVNAVQRGYDHSMSKKEAAAYYHQARDILFPINQKPESPAKTTTAVNEQKQAALNSLTDKLIDKHAHEPLLVYKLKSISNNDDAKAMEAVKQYIISSMSAYFKRLEFGGIGRDTKLLNEKKAVAGALLFLLRDDKITKPEEIHELLGLALQKTTQLRGDKYREGELDNRLRDCLLAVSVNAKSEPLSEDVKKAMKQNIENKIGTNIENNIERQKQKSTFSNFSLSSLYNKLPKPKVPTNTTETSQENNFNPEKHHGFKK